ncbi:MAG TPA: hypothetical protein VIG69_04080 [Candidatus Methylomirabilis sp.]|jgi:hypothetical protein
MRERFRRRPTPRRPAAATAADRQVRVIVSRHGKEQDLTVTIGTMPGEEPS